MLLRHLSVSGLLSFGPEGIDLPMRELNVLIGPNGSGKSNLIEILALLRASPVNLPSPMKEMGGVREWFWKGPTHTTVAQIEAQVVNFMDKHEIRHRIIVGENGGRFEVVDELIENMERRTGGTTHYNFHRGQPLLTDNKEHERSLRRENIRPEESILSQISDPEAYPVLGYLQKQYRSIRLFRNWEFGPQAAIRKTSAPDAPNDFLLDDGSNLDVVLSTFKGRNKKDLIHELAGLFQGIEDYSTPTGQNGIMLYLEESGGRSIPKTRLSDGTLRYLCLLAILLHPTPPPLVAIEEPELGLHPDVLPSLGRLIKRSSERMQLIVSTHSQVLLDSFSDEPDDVVVCSQENGVSSFDRLNADKLRVWLENHTLGELWSIGEIGGNRW